MGVFTFANEVGGLRMFREGEPAGHAAPLAAAKDVMPVLLSQGCMPDNVQIFFSQNGEHLELRTRAAGQSGVSVPAMRFSKGAATPAEISAFLHGISSPAQRRGAGRKPGAPRRTILPSNPQ